ncbi:DUF3883 domain-containing protein [Micromonospora zamorensis]|uniref:DUF3883 domain-containing protein n=1 Tax=Micromonospora zamorensis TaxID=709883 RepID=UPI0008201592|nr:DUF3883 domain-containing protein [Micromonospora zamorensis]SCG69535.1 protein of unknown function [Micromonospora zamorensis]
MGNSEIERIAIEYVMELERRNGRVPEDVHLTSAPYDVSSPPRQIEVKAFGASARSASVPLEDRQVQAARQEPENFYLYVVDNVARAGEGLMRVRIIHGDVLTRMLDRTRPQITYWPTLRAQEYDDAEQVGPIGQTNAAPGCAHDPRAQIRHN